jgi:hypothetical protein
MSKPLSEIKLTAQEAKAAGYKPGPPPKDRSNGIQISHAREDFICYIGPCEPVMEARLVCYRTENGCDECYWEDAAFCELPDKAPRKSK